MALEIAGIQMEHDVPDGWTPYGALAIIKCFGPEGEPRLLFRTSEGDWTMWEAKGALDMWATSLAEDFKQCLSSDDDDPESPE